MTDNFKILSDAGHLLLRPNMYIGSVTAEPHTSIFEYEFKTKVFVPGLIKIINELIDNSIDEHIRTDGEYATKIAIDIKPLMTGVEISVSDNGRGIPLKKIGDSYQPVLAWTAARAGSNFDDDRQSIGMNGIGSFATAVFSKKFTGTTSNGTDGIVVSVSDNCNNISYKLKQIKHQGTTVVFEPDLERFGLEEFDQDHIDVIRDRVLNLAICYKKIQFTFNGEKIKFKSLKDIAKKFSEDHVIVDEDNISLIIAPVGDQEEFQCLSYVNGLNVINGGSHIDYILSKIIETLRGHIKKKYKFDVLPNQIKQHILLASWLSGFRNLKFDSQTKQRITNSSLEVTEYFNTMCSQIDFEAIAKKVVNTPAIVDPIIDYQLRKKEAQEAAELRKKTKDLDKTNLRKISKFTDASEKILRKDCALMITEGDSAAASILSARTSFIGCYPLRGKFINAIASTTKELMDNKEFTELLAVSGLKIGEKVTSVESIRFGKIVSVTDADPDGHSISGLIMATLKKFWPELFGLGMVYRFRTPIMKVIIGKEEKYFDSLVEFETWSKTEKRSYKTRYLKGLGSSTAADFKHYFSQMETRLECVTIDNMKDLEIIDMLYTKEAGAADKRKDWLDLT